MIEHAIAIPAWLWKIIIIIFLVGQKPEYGGGDVAGKGDTHGQAGHFSVSSNGDSSGVDTSRGDGSWSVGHERPGSGGRSSSTKTETGSSINTDVDSETSTAIDSETSTGSGTETSISSTQADTGSTSVASDTTITSTSPTPTHTSNVPVQECGQNAYWDVFEDDMSSLNLTTWSLEIADKSMVDYDDGMSMHINQSSIYATLAHNYTWIPPVTIEASIIAAGVGGVLTAMIMKDETARGYEIDLEITEYEKDANSVYQMQLPIWKPSGGEGSANKLEKTGADVTDTVYNGFYEDKGNPGQPEWAYTYPGYDARKWVSYKLEWFADSITWYADGSKKVSFANKNQNNFPHTPLPFRAGLWAVSNETTAPDRNWAGTLNWDINKSPSMSIKNVVIAGCRAK